MHLLLTLGDLRKIVAWSFHVRAWSSHVDKGGVGLRGLSVRSLTQIFGYIKNIASDTKKGLTRYTNESPKVRLAAYQKTAELCIAPCGRPKVRLEPPILNIIIGIGSQLLFTIPYITPLLKIL